MIDPRVITDFNRSKAELEELWIFCVTVAGKNAMTTARNIDALLTNKELFTKKQLNLSPLKKVALLIKRGIFKEQLRFHGLGQYNRIERVLSQTIERKLNLADVSLEELEDLSGVGPKTSRFFILHTQRNKRHAIIDTHILKFLKDNGVTMPKSAPSGKKYLELEESFLELAGDRDIAEFDLEIWRKYSGH